MNCLSGDHQGCPEPSEDEAAIIDYAIFRYFDPTRKLDEPPQTRCPKP